MVSHITHFSLVIDFLDVDFSSSHISSTLKMEADKLITQTNLIALQGWELEFWTTYGSQSPIRVFKKYPSHKRSKRKSIFIHIPIPTKDIIAWGVNPNQQVTIGTIPNEHMHCSYLDVSFDRFSNRTDYILDSMRRAISFCFEEGFTVNSIKVKLSGPR